MHSQVAVLAAAAAELDADAALRPVLQARQPLAKGQLYAPLGQPAFDLL